MKTKLTIITTRYVKGYSSFGRNTSTSFGYKCSIESKKSIIPFHKEGWLCNLKNAILEKERFIFLFTKGFGGDILMNINGEIEKESQGFLVYNGNIYFCKITKGEKTNNGNGMFISATEWKQELIIETLKEIKLPYTGREIKRINFEYKVKGGVYRFSQENMKYEFISI